MAISKKQVSEMLHAIGYKSGKVSRGRYRAYRNHFCTSGKDQNWDQLVESGHATVDDQPNDLAPGAVFYHVTRKGLDFLEQKTQVKIVEEK